MKSPTDIKKSCVIVAVLGHDSNGAQLSDISGSKVTPSVMRF